MVSSCLLCRFITCSFCTSRPHHTFIDVFGSHDDFSGYWKICKTQSLTCFAHSTINFFQPHCAAAFPIIVIGKPRCWLCRALISFIWYVMQLRLTSWTLTWILNSFSSLSWRCWRCDWRKKINRFVYPTHTRRRKWQGLVSHYHWSAEEESEV